MIVYPIWVCHQPLPNLSLHSQKPANSVSFLLKEEAHDNSTCVGAAPSTNTTGAYKFVGTRAVGADAADKIDVVATTATGGG
jgi:hypothetical protein